MELHESAASRKLDDVEQIDRITEIQNSKTCEHCGEAFIPRLRSGGSPQRFCSTGCRVSFHGKTKNDDKRDEGEALNPSVSQRSPACGALPAVIDSGPQNSPADAPEADSEFDWSDTESVVLPEQYATACYFNKTGELVIRQKRWPDDDAFIYIAPDQIVQFIDKLTDIIGIPSVGKR